MKGVKTVLAALALLCGAAPVVAQTCASPLPLMLGVSSANTCPAPAGTGTNSIGTFCGAVPSTENELVYQVTLATNASITMSMTGVAAGFNPAMVLFQAADAGACTVASNCIGLPVDSNGNGGNESLSFSSLPGNLPPGIYYVAITGSPGTASCGSYNLTVAATPTPVQLQSFSVE